MARLAKGLEAAEKAAAATDEALKAATAAVEKAVAARRQAEEEARRAAGQAEAYGWRRSLRGKRHWRRLGAAEREARTCGPAAEGDAQERRAKMAADGRR